MALPLFQEKRFSTRQQLTGLLPGKIVLAETGEELLCKPVDISDDGLGIVAGKQLKNGQLLLLQLATDHHITLRVVWGKPDFGKRDMLRYGLMSDDRSHNLMEVFRVAGCLKE